MSDNKTVFPTTPPRPTSRRTLWLAGLAVVVVVIVATVLVVALTHGGTTTNRPIATTPSPTAPATTSTAGGSGFTGTTVDKLNKPVQLPANPAGQILPQTAKTPAGQDDAPAGLTWEKLYDLPIVPFSTSDGPTTITNGVIGGWAHTPQGAALAGQSILNLWLVAPDNVSETVQRTLLSGSPQVIAERTQPNRGLRTVGLSDPSLAPATFAAAQVRSYSGAFAQIDYAAGPAVDDTNPDGFYTVTTLSLAWQDGTWKLIVTPTSPDKGERRTSIAGMTPWTS